MGENIQHLTFNVQRPAEGAPGRGIYAASTSLGTAARKQRKRRAPMPAHGEGAEARGHGSYARCLALNAIRWGILILAIVPASLSAQNPTNALSPLVPAYGEIRPTIWEQYGTVIVIASVVFVALVGVVSWIMTRPKAPVLVSPEVLALDALTRLAGQPEDGKVLSGVSKALRRYVVAAFGLPAGESTTAEFSAALTQNEKIGGEPARTVSDFLHECDRRKFSPVSPDAPLNAARRALGIVSELEKQRAKFTVKS